MTYALTLCSEVYVTTLENVSACFPSLNSLLGKDYNRYMYICMCIMLK